MNAPGQDRISRQIQCSRNLPVNAPGFELDDTWVLAGEERKHGVSADDPAGADPGAEAFDFGFDGLIWFRWRHPPPIRPDGSRRDSRR